MLSQKLQIFIVLLISGIFLNNFVICIKFVEDDDIDDDVDKDGGCYIFYSYFPFLNNLLFVQQ